MTPWADEPFQVTAPQAAAVDKVIRLITRFGLETPAILSLESMRPLAFVGSQFMHVMSPAVGMLVPHGEWDQLASLLEDRRGVEYVIRRLETQAEEKRQR